MIWAWLMVPVVGLTLWVAIVLAVTEVSPRPGMVWWDRPVFVLATYAMVASFASSVVGIVGGLS